MCAKLRTAAVNNNRDHASQSLLLLVCATYIYCCSSRTSRSWWITQSTKRQRRIATTPLLFTTNHTDRTFFVWRLNSARPPHPGHSTNLMRSEIPSGMSAKHRTVAAVITIKLVAASNNGDHLTRSLYYCLFAPHIHIFVLRAHPVRGESHNQRNATERLQHCKLFEFVLSSPQVSYNIFS